MELTGEFNFDSPHHYTGTVRTKAEMTGCRRSIRKIRSKANGCPRVRNSERRIANGELESRMKKRPLNYSPFAIRHSLGMALPVLLSTQAAVAQERPAAFVDAATVVPGLVVDMRYAGAHNFVGRPIDGLPGAALPAHA